MTLRSDADFDKTLSALLKARADRALVQPDVGPLGAGQWGETERGEDVGRWWMAVAAVVVVITGSALAFRSSAESPSLGALGGTSRPADELSVDESDLIVWMEPGADLVLVSHVASLLEASPFVERFDYVDQAATWAEFKDYFADQPELLDLVDPAELPTSFIVRTGEPASVIELVEGQDGVNDAELSG